MAATGRRGVETGPRPRRLLRGDRHVLRRLDGRRCDAKHFHRRRQRALRRGDAVVDAAQLARLQLPQRTALRGSRLNDARTRAQARAAPPTPRRDRKTAPPFAACVEDRSSRADVGRAVDSTAPGQSGRARPHARIVHAPHRRLSPVRARQWRRHGPTRRTVHVRDARPHFGAATEIGVALGACVAAVRARDTAWTTRSTREPLARDARAFMNHRRATSRRVAPALERARITAAELSADGGEDGRTDATGNAADVEQAPGVRVGRRRADARAHVAQRRRQHRAALTTPVRATRRRAQRALERRSARRHRPAQPATRWVGPVHQAIAVVVLAVGARLTRARIHRGIERSAVAAGNPLTLLRQIAVAIDVDAGRRLAARLGARARQAHLPGLHAL
jgi:hypothetical protein